MSLLPITSHFPLFPLRILPSPLPLPSPCLSSPPHTLYFFSHSSPATQLFPFPPYFLSTLPFAQPPTPFFFPTHLPTFCSHFTPTSASHVLPTFSLPPPSPYLFFTHHAYHLLTLTKSLPPNVSPLPPPHPSPQTSYPNPYLHLLWGR